MPIKDSKRRKAYEKRRNATSRRRKMRSKNVMARRKMAKKYGRNAIKGKDVHHKRPISRGGGNGYGNLKIMSPRKNRSLKS